MDRNRNTENRISRSLLAVVFLTIATTASLANVPRTILSTDPSNMLGNLLFADTLSLNESKSFTIRANDPYNYTHIKAIDGQRYRFTVESPAWNNGLKETDAGGYNSTEPYASTRRHLDYKMMALVVEFYTSDLNKLAWNGRKMLIGLGPREWTANTSGYMVAFANDCLVCYADNSRVVTLTIKRIPA